MEAAEVWFVTKVLFKVLTKNDEWPSDILFFKDAVYFLTVVLKLETSEHLTAFDFTVCQD